MSKFAGKVRKSDFYEDYDYEYGDKKRNKKQKLQQNRNKRENNEFYDGLTEDDYAYLRTH